MISALNAPFAEQVAIVTGATSDIGRAIAATLSAHGAHTVLIGRNAKALEDIAVSLRAEKRQSLVSTCDVTRGKVVDVELQPGQMSLHHMYVVHGSGSNDSEMPRLGISINYLCPDVVDHAPTPRPARLLRGVDRHAHFASFERPST